MEETVKQQTEQEPAGAEPIRLPKNVRQIGAIEKESVIYIEDYVMTYLRQMIKKEGLVFGAAALYGRTVFKGKEKYVFVSGAVFAEDKPAEKSGSQDILENGPTKYMVREFREKKEKYFADMDPVGIAILHNENKRIPDAWMTKGKMLPYLGRGAVLMTMDADECEPELSFYLEDGVETQSGYYIYYERNEVMQSFLVEWHEGEQLPMDREKEDFAAGSCRMVMNERKEKRIQEKEDSYVSASGLIMLVAACIIGIVIVNQHNERQSVATVSANQETAMAEDVAGYEVEVISENELFGTISVSEANVAATDANVVDANSGDIDAGEGSATDVNLDGADEAVATDEVAATTEAVAADNGETAEVTEVQPEVSEVAEAEPVISDAGSMENLGMMEYTIEPGDTLETICRRYYGDITRVEEICELNNIDNKDTILYGQTIILP
ncbi:MAG: LysM peptidoglycan-binding domain-containing protein [Lachnospiraceae bacterium]|nr:LysM peptidoglycan-binding domain-containing protein [Lachnospiraceae bacterium]